MSQGKRSGLVAVGAMTLCCAGPALLAGGALGAVGGFLSSPLVVIAGGALALAAVVARRAARGDGACCPPSREDLEGRSAEPSAPAPHSPSTSTRPDAR